MIGKRIGRWKRTERMAVVIGIVLLALVVIVVWQGGGTGGSGENPEEIADGLSYVAAEQTKDVLEAQDRIAAASASAAETENENESEGIAQTGEPSETGRETEEEPVLPSLEEYREQLLAQVTGAAEYQPLDEEARAEYRRSFANCILFGDSMAQAAYEYGYLTEAQVIYRRGGTVDLLLEESGRVVAAYPERVIFFTGLNDCNRFETTDEYLSYYTQLAETIKNEAGISAEHIYICSLLPPNAEIAAARDDLARSDVFDAALHVLCENLGYTYIDTTWIVREDWYLTDGIHMTSEFYAIWIQYVSAVLERS